MTFPSRDIKLLSINADYQPAIFKPEVLLHSCQRYQSNLIDELEMGKFLSALAQLQVLQASRELWLYKVPQLARRTAAWPGPGRTVQPKARLTGEFQQNPISPLASVAAA